MDVNSPETIRVSVSNCVVCTFTTVLSDHIGEKPLALCSEGGKVAFVFTTDLPTFSGAAFCTVMDKIISSNEALRLGKQSLHFSTDGLRPKTSDRSMTH